MKLVALVLLLSGCAAFLEPVPIDAYTWEKTREAVPSSEHIVPQSAVQAYCGHLSAYVMACSYYDSEHCWIFASSRLAMEKMREHEQRHCAGWDHNTIGV